MTTTNGVKTRLGGQEIKPASAEHIRGDLIIAESKLRAEAIVAMATARAALTDDVIDYEEAMRACQKLHLCITKAADANQLLARYFGAEAADTRFARTSVSESNNHE